MHDIMDRVTNISWRTTSGATLGVGNRLASYGRARSPSAPQYVVGACTYDAWGNVVDEEIVPSASALAALRYRFQGREWSAAAGLVNFRMRWYDPETGRWLSRDPIGLSGGLNLYVFCANCTIMYIDPYGEDFCSAFDMVSDFCAGFADTMSFGGTRIFRETIFPLFGISDPTDMAATAYAAGVYTGVGYDIALGATGGWAAGGTKAVGKEFSHWILNRVLKRSGSDFWVKKFGRSKFNGNYVTPTRHAQHDPFRHYNSTVKFHALIRQIDRVPRVYYGSLTGCIAGSLSGAGSSEYDKD